jgi:hypothetical protein
MVAWVHTIHGSRVQVETQLGGFNLVTDSCNLLAPFPIRTVDL